MSTKSAGLREFKFFFMASDRRIEKLNTLLKEEVSRILQRDIEFPEGTLLTVTKVSVSPNLEKANIYVSIFGRETAEVLEILQKTVYTVQQSLNRRMRMRPVPKIVFLLDENELRRETVERSLAELKKKGEL